MMLLIKLESIEHARFRALAQLQIDTETGSKAFDEYAELAFPYMKAAKKQDRQKVLDMLKQEIGRGPMRVTPQEQPRLKSKMKTRVIRDTPLTEEQAAKLYSKMGRSIPID